jgi:hypothetical protein
MPSCAHQKRARTSGSERERAGTSGNERERARTSGNERERAGTSGNERERARTSGNERERAGTSGNERKRAGTSGSERERAGTSGNERKRAETSGNERERAGTSGNERERAGASENSGNGCELTGTPERSKRDWLTELLRLQDSGEAVTHQSLVRRWRIEKPTAGTAAMELAQLMRPKLQFKGVEQLRGSIRFDIDREEFSRNDIVHEINRDPKVTKVGIVEIDDHG